MLIFTITLYVGIVIPILQGMETEAKEFSKLFECFQIISGRVKTSCHHCCHLKLLSNYPLWANNDKG